MSKKEKEELMEDDFFDKSDIRRAGRRVKSLDDDKPKHSFLKFIFILLILLIAFGCIYYFVLDTPKTFYTKIVNKLSNEKKITSGVKDTNLSYSFDADIKTGDEEYQKIFDVINKTKVNGIIKYDEKEIIGSNNIKYKNDDLIDVTYTLDIDNKIAYFKLDKVLDKTIKMDINTEEDEEETYNFDKDVYKDLYKSFMKNLKPSLEKATYERKITILNKNIAFKDTLIIDEEFEKEFLTKLLHDDNFIENYAKLDGSTIEEASDEINKEIAELKEEKSTITIHRSIIKNEILKIEVLDEDDTLTVTKENDKYNYEIITKKNEKYKGYIKVNKDKNETSLSFNLEAIKEEIDLTINITYSNNEYKIETVDKEKAVDFEKLSEEDMTKIYEYITENKTVSGLIKDLQLEESLSENTNSI